MRAQSWMWTALVWRLMVLKLSWSYFWNGTGFSQCCPAFQSFRFVSCIWSLKCVFNIIFSWHGLWVLFIFNIWIEEHFPVVSAVQILVWFLLKGKSLAPRDFSIAITKCIYVHVVHRSGLAWKQMIDVGVSCRHGISWDGTCDSLQPLWLGFWDRSWRLECTVDYWENSGGGWFGFHLWRGGRVWNCKGLKYRVFNMLHLFWKAYRGWIHNGSFTLL